MKMKSMILPIGLLLMAIEPTVALACGSGNYICPAVCLIGTAEGDEINGQGALPSEAREDLDSQFLRKVAAMELEGRSCEKWYKGKCTCAN